MSSATTHDESGRATVRRTCRHLWVPGTRVPWARAVVAAFGAAVVGLLCASTALAAKRPAPVSAATLLARHVPILVLHPAERHRPVPVDGFLADSDVQRLSGADWVTVSEPLPLGGPDYRLDQRSCRAVEGMGASPCYAEAEKAHGAAPVVYGAAFRTRDRIELQYWLWYPYNDFSPTIPAGDVWQVHEGDWEAVSVVLDLQGRPLFAGYSQHSSGERRDWAAVPVAGRRPLVYVALGSHANYFAPGEHPLDPRRVDPNFINVIAAYGISPADHTGAGSRIDPRLVVVTATRPSWMTFAGAWGETGYVHVPNNAPFASGAGPRGPAFHRQWQAPVREVSSWPRGS